jgi:biotin synthase
MTALYKKIELESDLKFCCSAGLLDQEQARKVHSMGVERYHCNLESCRSYFPHICTTHTYDDKIRTLQVARQAGLSLCSGGIIGMGESMEERIDLALELRELEVLSIPINLLTPITATPLADLQPPPLQDALTTVALFRLITPHAVIRMAGGRRQYGQDQYRFFQSGANGAIVGNYLTTAGNSLTEDLKSIQALGFDIPTARE